MHVLNKILVTGGLGFIGRHITCLLIDKGYEVVVIDNLINSNKKIIKNIEKITSTNLNFIELDITNQSLLNNFFNENSFDTIVHLAALKSVEDSIKKPIDYFENNVGGLISILKNVKKHNIRNFVFSSSATVYGVDNTPPFTEKMKIGSTSNPYGDSKLFCENIIDRFYSINKELSCCTLRYFNPIGAHSSGLIGEDLSSKSTNIMPLILKAASSNDQVLSIYGKDYETPDGTCIRDYIHVSDLAEGHESAIRFAKANTGNNIFNMGTGKGVSVLELIDAFKKINKVDIKTRVCKKRAGDIESAWANTDLVKLKMNWVAKRTINDMVEDAWRWHLNQKIKNTH